MKKLLPISFVICCLILVLGTTSKAVAQTPGSTRVMTVVPPTENLVLAPGETAEGTLKVVNDSDETLNFISMMRDYVVRDEKGTPEILPPDTLSNKYSAASWIGVSPASFNVAPHQRQELTYFVQVPPNARPGGHYAAVMYQPTNVIDVKGTGTGVFTYVGTLFYIQVKGDIAEKAQVTQFSAKGFSEYGPVKITTVIQNQGDLHIRPTGIVTVKNLIGQVVSQEKLEEHNIFPEASFLYTNNLGKKWMIGPYYAEFSGTYGLNGNLPLVAKLTFFVFPWKIAVILVLIIVIAVLGYVAMKRRKHHEGHHEEASASESHDSL